MRLFGLMVTKNESHRYLEAATQSALSYLDGLLVFDDNSIDQTCEIANKNGATVIVKPEKTPDFLEHEGAFRQASLDALQNSFGLQKGDWIFVIDADEFIVSNVPNIRQAIEAEVRIAQKQYAWSIILERKEVWAVNSEGRFMVRVDGRWGGMRCTRLFRWRPNGKIQQKSMGCGNEPTYINEFPMHYARSFEMLHLGYLDKQDAAEKYERYNKLLHHGHDDSHIQSILGEAELMEWEGPDLLIWRGVKKPF